MDIKRHFNSLHKELGITPARARHLTRENIIPEALALKAERITDGALSAVDLCPALDEPQPAHNTLASSCVAYFAAASKSDNGQLLLIQNLNFLEKTQPTLYKQVIAKIKDQDGGSVFVANRCDNGNG